MFFIKIMEIPKHFQKAMIFRNYFFMVKSTVVQQPLLARLATVSVLLFSWRGIFCPSSYYSSSRKISALRDTFLAGRCLLYELLLFQQEDRCSTSYGHERWTVNLVTARETRRAGAPPANIFQKIWKFQKISSFFNFFEKLKPYRTLKFQNLFQTLIPFL